MITDDEGRHWASTYRREREALEGQRAAGRITPDEYTGLRRELERCNACYTVLSPAELEDLQRWEAANRPKGLGTSDWPGWRHHGLLGFGTTPWRIGERPEPGDDDENR
ncbi:MAG: hypothetical protein M3Q65_07160 [Chloroflexota bacterium]|nr:hypothetical protein [Chloroflexota bacterium]